MGLDWSAVETGCTGMVTAADEYGQLGDRGASVCAISSVSCSIFGQKPVRAGLGVVWCQIQRCLVRFHIYRTRHWLDRGMETNSH